MSEVVQPKFQAIDCELGQKFHRKEIISKIQSKSCSQIELEINSLQQYAKLEEHLQEILSAQPAKIARLSIILSGMEVGQNIISKISANLINMKNLQYFNLEVSNSGISESDIQPLLYELVDIPQLQNLSLDISSNSKVSSNAGQVLGINISQLISLKKLELNLSNCQNVDNDCINRFSSLIRRMISLESISLHLQQTGIKKFNFFKELSEIRLLHKLQLSFALIAEEDQQSFESISALSPKIRSLSLNLHGSYFTKDQELGKSFVSNLGNTLDCFSSLKKLYLNLERSHLSSNSITILLKKLAGKLQEGVILHLNSKEVDNYSQILEAIRRMRSETLSVLALNKLLLPKYFQLLTQD